MAHDDSISPFLSLILSYGGQAILSTYGDGAAFFSFPFVFLFLISHYNNPAAGNHDIDRLSPWHWSDLFTTFTPQGTQHLDRSGMVYG
jgi:hypothetical protein